MIEHHKNVSSRMMRIKDEFSDMTRAETAHYIQLMEANSKIRLTSEQRDKLMKKNRNYIDTFFSDLFMVNGK